MKFLFDGQGEPRAYFDGSYLYDLEGYAVGFVEQSHVHRLDGSYVGALHQDMVVDTFESQPGPTQPRPDPGRIPPPDRPLGRGTFDYGYPDRLDRLFSPDLG